MSIYLIPARSEDLAAAFRAGELSPIQEITVDKAGTFSGSIRIDHATLTAEGLPVGTAGPGRYRVGAGAERTLLMHGPLNITEAQE